jgi:hypothetical protein
VTLSSTCPDEFYGDPGEWWYFPPEPDDLKPFTGKRRKRCSSCKSLIDIGEESLEFKRERAPYTELEEDISGCEIPMASLFFCERCSEIYLNLTDVGYCFSPKDDMNEALNEYWRITGFIPTAEHVAPRQ